MTTNRSQRGNGLADTPEEETFLINLGVVTLTGLLGSAGILWLKGATWLVEHQILVAADQDPLLVVAGTGGAGLDISRLAIAAAAVLVVLVLLVSAGRRSLARRRQELDG